MDNIELTALLGTPPAEDDTTSWAKVYRKGKTIITTLEQKQAEIRQDPMLTEVGKRAELVKAERAALKELENIKPLVDQQQRDRHTEREKQLGQYDGKYSHDVLSRLWSELPADDPKALRGMFDEADELTRAAILSIPTAFGRGLTDQDKADLLVTPDPDKERVESLYQTLTEELNHEPNDEVSA